MRKGTSPHAFNVKYITLVIRANRGQNIPQEELEEVLLSVVETILNFLHIHRKVIFPHALGIVQDMSSKRSETFGPVDMTLGPAIHEALATIDRVIFSIAS